MTRIKALHPSTDTPHCLRMRLEEIKNHDADTSNQKLWKTPDGKFYSYDRTAHGGGVWKEFAKIGKSFKRIATLDEALEKIRN